MEVPYPDAQAILEYLREKGYKIGIIANQSAGTHARLKKWNLLPYMNFILASAELGIAKPDPKIFQCALETAGCRKPL